MADPSPVPHPTTGRAASSKRPRGARRAPGGGCHEIDVASALLRAAAHLDAAARAADRGFKVREPLWFRKEQAEAAMRTHFTTAVEHGRRALRELEGVGAPAEDARAGVASAIRYLDPTLPPVNRFDLPLVASRSFFRYQEAHGQLHMLRDRLRLHAELERLPPGIGTQRMQAEVDAILQLPDAAITSAQLRRLGLADGLPEHLRPQLAVYRATNRHMAQWDRDTSFELIALQGGTAKEYIVQWALRNARVDMARRVVAAEPGVTRSRLDAELRRIVAKPIDEITQADQDRLSMMAGLGDELRPRLLDTRLPWPDSPLDQLAAVESTAVHNDPLRGKLESLRAAIEVESLIADPSVTRQSVARELAEILATPPMELSEEALRRMSVLMRLPEHLRPASPLATYHHYGIEDLGLLGPRFQPPRNTTAAIVWSAERAPLLAEVGPEALVREIRAGIARGNLDPYVAAAASPDVLRQAGLDPAMVHGNALAELAGASTSDRQDIAQHLRLLGTHTKVLRLEDARHVELRTELLELIERNLARIDGIRIDTFARHPDYAEVGRIVSSGHLLQAIAGSRPAARAAAAADTPAEMLRW